MRICVVAPPGECLQVKANTALFAGNTERVRGVREVLYKSTLSLPLLLRLNAPNYIHPVVEAYSVPQTPR